MSDDLVGLHSTIPEEDVDLLGEVRDYESTRRKRSIPRNRTITAVALLIVGAVLCVIGLSQLMKESPDPGRGWSLIALGSLCIVPGAYYVYILVRVLRGESDARLENLPGYEDTV